jgi:biopolymer transport protein ExbD
MNMRRQIVRAGRPVITLTSLLDLLFILLFAFMLQTRDAVDRHRQDASEKSAAPQVVESPDKELLVKAADSLAKDLESARQKIAGLERDLEEASGPAYEVWECTQFHSHGLPIGVLVLYRLFSKGDVADYAMYAKSNPERREMVSRAVEVKWTPESMSSTWEFSGGRWHCDLRSSGREVYEGDWWFTLSGSEGVVERGRFRMELKKRR